jgi:AcrR family transcriptional regulator
MPTKKNADTRDAIAKAAMRCFERYGPQRTSMADIADAAEMSRQSVYRFFEDRSALIQYILNQRISALAEALRVKFALIEGSVISIRASREDTLFDEIVANGTDHGVELFLLRGTEDIRRIMGEYWKPLLDQARKEGRLRPGITNERILEWIRHIHTILRLRDDQDEEAQRRMLRDFLVPSIMSQPPQKIPKQR